MRISTKNLTDESEVKVLCLCLLITKMNSYICINCGMSVKALYKKYNESVLKLISCESCKNVADKYIEYDPVIIIIDLVLLSKEAYRHILYNTEFKIHWKFAVMLLIMEAYGEYILSTNSENTKELNEQVNLDYFRHQDTLFYKILAKCAIQTFCFISTIVILTALYKKLYKKSGAFSLIKIWKAIVLSSFGIFLLLPSLIWRVNTFNEFHITFVYLYTTLSQLLAYTVVCRCSKHWSICVILIAYFSKICCERLISTFI